MKKLKYILSAIVSIILLVSLMTFCNTTVMAATKIPSTSISSIKVKMKQLQLNGRKNQVLQDTKFSILLIVSLKKKKINKN